MCRTGGLFTLGADTHDLAGVDGAFLLDDAAFIAHLAGLGVTGADVDALDDDLALCRHGGQDFADLTLVFAAQDDDLIALLDAHFLHSMAPP